VNRWVIGSVLFIVALFMFFVGYAVSSLLLGTVGDAMAGPAAELNSSEYNEELVLIPSAFGVICAISVVMIIVVYMLDSLSDEPESYWKE
jgi:hypothetical protein